MKRILEYLDISKIKIDKKALKHNDVNYNFSQFTTSEIDQIVDFANSLPIKPILITNKQYNSSNQTDSNDYVKILENNLVENSLVIYMYYSENWREQAIFDHGSVSGNINAISIIKIKLSNEFTYIGNFVTKGNNTYVVEADEGCHFQDSKSLFLDLDNLLNKMEEVSEEKFFSKIK